MKSLTAVTLTGASMPAINPNGRIQRHPPHRGDGENAEMKMYLSKLKDLVPFMPKNRKLSKLEIIQHVIDYICDLQTELETHPEIGNFDAASALNFTAAIEGMDAADRLASDEEDQLAEEQQQQLRLQPQAQQQLQQQQQQLLQQLPHSSPAAPRQPLVDRQAPNTILPVAAAVAASLPAVNQHQHFHQQQQQQQQMQLVAPLQSSSPTPAAEKDSRQQASSC